MSTTLAENQTNNVNERELAIELVEVSKRYGSSYALTNISLDIYSGEFIVLLGPSGCGKSTLLKIIAGLEDATDGELYIHGELSNYVDPKKRDVAMVFQNYALYPHMTVAKNIGFPLRMRRTSKAVMRERVQEVAKLLEIDQMLDKYPDQLSGGQRQRVALGRALIRDPIAFLLDEPLSNLDALLRLQMRDELINFHRRVGRTIVYVTHDQIEAMTMAHRIVVLREGEIQQVETPYEIFARPANTFVATFVGSPQMNLLPGSLEASSNEVVFSSFFQLPLGRKFDLPDNPQQVSLGIRPDDVLIVGESEPGSLFGNVSRIEPIGSDTNLRINVNGDTVIKARVPAEIGMSEGDDVHIKLQPDKTHVFDSTGVRHTPADV